MKTSFCSGLPRQLVLASCFLASSFLSLISGADAAPFTGGTFHLEVDGANISGTLTILTGATESDFTLTTTPERVIAGLRTVRLVFDTNGITGWRPYVGNIAWIQSILAANLLAANGGFEVPVQSAASYSYNPAGAAWTFVGSSGIQRNGSTWGTATAPEGAQTAFLQGISTGAGSFSPTLTLPAGDYQIRFQGARRSGKIQPIQVKVDAKNVGTAVSPPGNSFSLCQSQTFNVTAGSHTIAFFATSKSGEKTSFVDDVQIVPVSTGQVAQAAKRAQITTPWAGSS